MEFPVRCFTCGGVIGDLYEDYRAKLAHKNAEAALDELNVDRYCCRRMFISHVDLVPTLLKYKKV
ncbi:DNA-directed RNA polymerase subunit N [Candidatus Micrarchaeota archaeon]|nr:DNA-directed RNA polymerase subunit N [Candidatus Micrarchaeota archaeon]